VIKERRRFKKSDGPKYDRDDKQRIWRSLCLLRARTGESIDALTMRINAVQGWPHSLEYPLNAKTLRRFYSGDNIWNIYAKFIEVYLDQIAPEQPIETFGDSLALFLGGRMFESIGDQEAAAWLGRRFVKAYDVFAAGRLIEPPPRDNPLQKRYVHPEPDPFDRPFEVPYSRLYLRAVPGSRWLRTTEFVFNPTLSEIRAADDANPKTILFEGALTFADFNERYVLVSRSPSTYQGDSFAPATVFIIEEQNHIDAELPLPYVGAMISTGKQGYVTDIRGSQVRLMPVKGSQSIAMDDDNGP
jgi:hypothetical protein